MSAKVASRNTGSQKEEKIVLTDVQMFTEVRLLRAGKLFVGNMSYVDAVIRSYDALLESGRTTNRVIDEGISKLDELRIKLQYAETSVKDYRAVLADSQHEADEFRQLAATRAEEIRELNEIVATLTKANQGIQ